MKIRPLHDRVLVKPLESTDGCEYIVQQGDCIESIAAKHGLSWQKLWNHPRNKKLRAKRKNPNILLQGDRLYVPAIDVQSNELITDKRHRFCRLGVPSKFQIRLLDIEGNPRGGIPFALYVDGFRKEGLTDADGWIRVSIPPQASIGQLIVNDQGIREVHDLRLGYLDPIAEVTGVQQRLNNLGFDCGEPDGELNESTRECIRAFQHDYQLRENGDMDQATLSKLEEVYGS